MTKPAILTATLTMRDAWGKPRTVEVEWMPLDITEIIDPARLNKPSLGRIYAHGTADDAPVYLTRNQTGGVALVREVRSHAAETSHTTEFTKVADREQLEPGTFFIAHDTEA